MKMIRLAKLIIILLISSLFLIGCTDEKNAKRILEDNGYQNIRFTGYKIFSCSKDDWYHTGFVADSSTGKPIAGTVCSGIFFKNSTIRFE